MFHITEIYGSSALRLMPAQAHPFCVDRKDAKTHGGNLSNGFPLDPNPTPTKGETPLEAPSPRPGNKVEFYANLPLSRPEARAAIVLLEILPAC